MNLENLNILSTGWFIFFLLIFLVWYFFTEFILLGKILSNLIKNESKESLFYRIINYIFFGFLITILFFILIYFTWIFNYLEDIITDLSVSTKLPILQNTWIIFIAIWFLLIILLCTFLRGLYFLVKKYLL